MKGTGEHAIYFGFDGVLQHEDCLWQPKRFSNLVALPR